MSRTDRACDRIGRAHRGHSRARRTCHLLSGAVRSTELHATFHDRRARWCLSSAASDAALESASKGPERRYQRAAATADSGRNVAGSSVALCLRRAGITHDGYRDSSVRSHSRAFRATTPKVAMMDAGVARLFGVLGRRESTAKKRRSLRASATPRIRD